MCMIEEDLNDMGPGRCASDNQCKGDRYCNQETNQCAGFSNCPGDEDEDEEEDE